MNGHESNKNKNRRKSEITIIPKIDLNISKIINSKLKYSISPRKIEKRKHSKIISTNLNTKDFNYNNKAKIMKKQISVPTSFKRNSAYNPFIKSIDNNLNIFETKRYSLELIKTKKTKKFYQKYNLKMNIDNSIKKKSLNNPLSVYELNFLENNIKNALNDMKIKIEKEGISEKENEISPPINKLASSPNLVFAFKKKKIKNEKNEKNEKKILQSSLLMKETHIIDSSFNKKDKKKRNRSFDISEKAKKKLLLKLKNKFFKKSSGLFSTIIINHSSYEDSDNNNENYKGFALLPTNSIIFIFDLLLIFADLYTFIFIPLNVAQNKDIREKGNIVLEIIHHMIDLIFLADFVLSFFKGYYDNEMNIVRNNKKIINHYLSKYFISDFLQAIPLYTIIRIFLKPNEYMNSSYSRKESFAITFLLIIKPFKTFKIIKKKQNIVLEDFYSYLSENYYLEELARFLIYFLIFFLFIHLFICLHIYFAFQNYPNWMTHTKIINSSFFDKYIASFYFMITTMTTVGYGDIVCISHIERIYHIILLVLGTLLYTFLVSKIGNYLRDQSHEQIKLSKDLNILESIRVSYPSMSYNLYSKIKNHLQSIFNKRKKTGISLLINGVPDAIKNDLLFKIYSKVINEFSIFKNVKNSNFVLQVLTSFIPIVSKKEEIIILEGEIIQNIIFVKDGRLSLEIGIDLNDPYKSIENYIQVNFTAISKQDDLNNKNFLNGDISMMIRPERNYNDLKTQIDNVLLDNQNTLFNNSKDESNGISVDLGRLDFSRNENEKYNGDNYQIIKVIDLRKNEHFGDVHLIAEKPSPFTLKAKSRIAELLLLRKHDAIVITKNFPNIWRRIQSKSYHNLVSLKKLTFKKLKRYFNTNFYNKNNRETIANLDVTKASARSFLDAPSILKNLKTMNKSYYTNNNANNSKNTILETSKLNNKSSKSVNKNKLFVGYEKKRKVSGDSFINELDFSSDSFNSFNSSNFKMSNEIINQNNNKNQFLPIININEEKDKIQDLIPVKKIQNSNTSKAPIGKMTFKQLENKKTLDNFTFKNESESNKKIKCPKNLLSINRSKSKCSSFKTSQEILDNYDHLLKTNINSKKLSDRSLNINISKNETIKFCNQNLEDIENENNNINIITLEDVNQNFSRKIKKKLKKRKKIQKLRELLKLQKLKISKNLLGTFKRQNSFNKNNEIIPCDNINYSISSSSKSKVFSQLMESTTSEGGSSTNIYNHQKFNFQSLKMVSSISFEIKSYYKNINSLTKGKMISNIKYKKYIEYIISKYINKKNENKDNYKLFLPSISLNNKRIKNFLEINKSKEFEFKKKSNKNNYSEGNLNLDSKTEYKAYNLNESNKNLHNNFNIKSDQRIKNFLVSIEDRNKETRKNKISSKNIFKKNDIEDKSKVHYIENSNHKGNIENKYFNNIKKENKKKEKSNNSSNKEDNEINNKSIKSSLNAFKEYDKYYDSNNENKLSILNKNNFHIDKNTPITIFEEGKTKKCIIF